jgi:hypothetical protein
MMPWQKFVMGEVQGVLIRDAPKEVGARRDICKGHGPAAPIAQLAEFHVPHCQALVGQRAT